MQTVCCLFNESRCRQSISNQSLDLKVLYVKTQSAGAKIRITPRSSPTKPPKYTHEQISTVLLSVNTCLPPSQTIPFSPTEYAVTRRMSSLTRAEIKLKSSTQLLLTGLLTHHAHRSLTRHVTTRNNRQIYRDSPKAPRRNTGQFEGQMNKNLILRYKRDASPRE